MSSSNNNKEGPKKSTSVPSTKPSSPPPASVAKPPAKPATTPASTTTTKPAPTSVSKPSSATTPPAKKEPEPPAFEKGLVDELKKQFGDSINVVFIKPRRMKILVDPYNINEVGTFVRDRMGFDHAESVAGTDYPKDGQIEVVYHLGSYTRDDLSAHILMLSTRTSRDDARLPTLINVFKSVEYHERETFEMLGVYFEGHPRNDRFLLPEDWADIPPLRKDFRIKGR
jgi:NADH-quinone oxidoreductase subunit C